MAGLVYNHIHNRFGIDCDYFDVRFNLKPTANFPSRISFYIEKITNTKFTFTEKRRKR